MTNSNWGKRLWLLAATACVVGLGATEARADWGSNGGSWGGSHGSSGGGSVGGSSGGRLFGGSHGGPVRNLIGRIRDRHASSGGGSWGNSSGGRLLGRGYGSSGHASSGGHSSGGYRYYSASSGGSSGGSHVSYGSSGGHGSSGGSWQSSANYGSAPYYSPQTISDPAYGNQYNPYGNGFESGIPTESTPVDLTPSPGPTGTEVDPAVDDDTAILNLRLPAEAVVYVNGKQTRTPGEFRSYVSRNLEPGKRYTYEVRAEVNQGGTKVARTKVVHLTAGSHKTVDIEFDESRQVVTSVTLMVPDDAKVSLAGAETSANGSMRYFSTTALKEGEKWEDYKVAVTVNRDGKDVTQERVVRLTAGESLNLEFDFDADAKLASR